MENIDDIRVAFDPAQLQLLNSCLAFLMFAIALDIKLGDFKAVWSNRRAVLIGLVCQYLAFPVATLVLIALMQPPTSIALGMLLVAACPSGNIANYATHLAGANVPLSITLNGLISLGAVVMTPFVFGLGSQFIEGSELFQQALHLEATQMLGIIIRLIVLPLGIGMALQHYVPQLVTRIRSIVKVLSLLVFAAIVVTAFVRNWHNVVAHISKVFTMVAILNATALVLGYYLARLARLSMQDCRTLSIEAGIHNTGLGLVLIFNFFDGIGGMAIIAAWYGVWDLISIFVLASWWRKYS